MILTFAQFFSPISENTSPSLRFLVLHFQQSHIFYCRQKWKRFSNKEIHQSLIFIIIRKNISNGIFRWAHVWNDMNIFCRWAHIWNDMNIFCRYIWSVSQEGRNNGILIRVKSLSPRDFLRRLTTNPRDSPSLSWNFFFQRSNSFDSS